jgi:hypothetical protein
VHDNRLRTALALTLVLACAGLALAPAAHAAGPASGDEWSARAAWSGLGERLAGWLDALLDGAFQPTPTRLTAASGSGMDPNGEPAPDSGSGMDPDGSPTPAGGGHMDPNG